MANDARKAELIADLDRARSRASAYRQQIKKSPERVSAKAEANLARNRYTYIIGAVLAGFLISKLPARTKKVVVNRRGEPQKAGFETAGKTGLLLAILKIAIDATKPVLMAWITKRLGEAVSVGKDVRRGVNRVERKT
jgi:hypothetical protein